MTDCDQEPFFEDNLPLIFQEAPSSMSEALIVKRSEARTSQLVELDEEESVLRRRRTFDASPNFASMYGECSVTGQCFYFTAHPTAEER